MLLLESFVTEDVNATFDVSLMFVIAVVSIPLAKTVLPISARVVVGANNSALPTVFVDVTLASIVGVDCVFIALSFNALLVVISTVKASVDSVLVVVSS